MKAKDVKNNIIQIKQALSTDTHLYGRLPDVEDRLDKIESKLNLTGTAGDVEIPCDVCGVSFKPKHSKYACDTCCPPPPESTKRERMRILPVAPDLPLNARVAKALGKEIVIVNDKWQIVEVKSFVGTGLESHAYDPIPDYSNDRDAAMGVLEEYCQEKRNFTIAYYPDYSKPFRVSVWGEIKCGEKTNLSEVNNNSLPQAICEVIVKHAEG